MTYVSVVVPTFRRPDLLSRCLAALVRQQYAADQFEIIVADDAVEETTRRQVESIVASGFTIRYVPVTGHHGPAAARNAGWRIARGKIIAFTDDDCIPQAAWLAAGVLPFGDPAVIAVTGQTIVPLPPNPTDYERNAAGLEQSEFVTANCFCRRDALRSLGGFDERFKLAWREDSDLHFRLLDAGGRITRANDAVVVHPVRAAAWGISLREQRKAAFDALLFRKHPRSFRQRIRPACPWDYYLIAISFAAAICSAVLGAFTIAIVTACIWLFLTGRFAMRRLKSTSRAASHVVEISLTSLLIPFLSIYWRLYGAARFGVFFW